MGADSKSIHLAGYSSHQILIVRTEVPMMFVDVLLRLEGLSFMVCVCVWTSGFRDSECGV